VLTCWTTGSGAAGSGHSRVEETAPGAAGVAGGRGASGPAARAAVRWDRAVRCGGPGGAGDRGHGQLGRGGGGGPDAASIGGGGSGAGKITLLYNVVDQVSVPFWAFDLKHDYLHLVREQDDLLVLPWTESWFNPLRPPEGVAPLRWARVCTY